MSTIAFASGFASIRRFNAAFRVVYRRSPTAVRRARAARPRRRCRAPSPVALFRREEPTMAKGTLIAAMSIGQAAEDEFQDWYDTEHIPALAAVPGVLCARRFRGTGNRKYVALYHLATPEVQDSAEWKQARQSDWTRRLQPHFRDHLRLVLRRYVRGA